MYIRFSWSPKKHDMKFFKNKEKKVFVRFSIFVFGTGHFDLNFLIGFIFLFLVMNELDNRCMNAF